jgi:hypothetical protein
MTPKLKLFAPLVLSVLFVLSFPGCDKLTPDAAVKVSALEASAKEAQAKFEAGYQRFLLLKAEYAAIKAKVDAGEPLPPLLAARFTELAQLLVGAATDVTGAEAAVKDLLAKREAAAKAGTPWYWQIPWEAVAGVALGIAGIYFPVVRPLQGSAAAIIQGVRAANTANPEAGQAVKDAVCAEARALGVESAVDKLVQKYDPPIKSA